MYQPVLGLPKKITSISSRKDLVFRSDVNGLVKWGKVCEDKKKPKPKTISGAREKVLDEKHRNQKNNTQHQLLRSASLAMCLVKSTSTTRSQNGLFDDIRKK